jgi:hypothetical protein
MLFEIGRWVRSDSFSFRQQLVASFPTSESSCDSLQQQIHSSLGSAYKQSHPTCFPQALNDRYSGLVRVSDVSKVVDLNYQSRSSSSTSTNILTKGGTMEETTTSSHCPSHNPDSYLKYSTNKNPNVSPSHSSLTAAHHSNVKSIDVEAGMAESLTPSDSNMRPKYFSSTFKECIFVFTVMMSGASTTFLQGVTVINTATIGRELKMSAAEVIWISAALGYENHDLSLSRQWLTSL